jgi:cell division transport system ATP-binding protein
MSDRIALEMQNVFVRYAASDFALQDVNLKVKQNDFYFLTGDSGAGKTTLLKLIYLHLKAQSGKLKLFGNDMSLVPRAELPFFKRRIGVVFQDYRLINHLSAFENVALPLVVSGVKEKEIKKQVSEMLDWVGLANFMHKTPRELSGGQQQRIAIARAVINKPDIIVADEPTGNVDAEMAKKLLHLFVEMNKQNTAIIIATHSQDLCAKFNFPRFHLEKGKLEILQPLGLEAMNG